MRPLISTSLLRRRRATIDALAERHAAIAAAVAQRDALLEQLDAAVDAVARADALVLAAGGVLEGEGDASTRAEHCRHRYEAAFNPAAATLDVTTEEGTRYQLVEYHGRVAITSMWANELSEAAPWALVCFEDQGVTVFDTVEQRYVGRAEVIAAHAAHLGAARRAGADAHDTGIPSNACPYDDADAAEAWQEGWIDRGVELRDQADVDAQTDDPHR